MHFFNTSEQVVSVSVSSMRDWKLICSLDLHSAPEEVLTIRLSVALLRYCMSPFLHLFCFLLWEFFSFTHIHTSPYNFLTELTWMTPYLTCLSALHSAAIQHQTMQSVENRCVEVTFV